jgi:hypothetical protein
MGLFGGRKKKQVDIRNPHISEQNEAYTFRRSRTITGSSASSVRAASEDRGQLRSSRLHEHDLRRHRRKLWAYLFACAIFIGMLGLVLEQYSGNDVLISTSSAEASTKNIDTERYRRMAAQYYNAHPLEHFRFALNLNAFAEDLRSKAPEVADAEVVRGNGVLRGEVKLTFRKPIASWDIKGQKYYVDASGEAFQINYYSEPAVTVIDESGIDPNATGTIASGRFLRFMGRLITLIDESGVTSVTGVVIPRGVTRQIDLKLDGVGYPFKTNLDRDPAGQAADVVNAYKYFTARGIVPQYVDVRVSSKAFYR